MNNQKYNSSETLNILGDGTINLNELYKNTLITPSGGVSFEVIFESLSDIDKLILEANRFAFSHPNNISDSIITVDLSGQNFLIGSSDFSVIFDI